MRANSITDKIDRFGFPIDQSVGYARGTILSSPLAETHRLQWAWEITRARSSTHGASSFVNFTGNIAEFPLDPEDLPLCEEWVGQALVIDSLQTLALDHMGGQVDRHGFTVLARTSGAILTWFGLYGFEGTVLSVVPTGGHGHSSLHHAARVCRTKLVEVEADQLSEAFINEHRPTAAVITSVTSSLEELDGSQIKRVAETLRSLGCLSLLDDAYGARLRPIVRGGPKSLKLGVDVAVTNADKVGLGGPRCCFVAGDPALVNAMSTWAAQAGLDGRAPVLAGALAALRNFSPQFLRDDIEDGLTMSQELIDRFGENYVTRTPLGPTIGEENALQLLFERYGFVNVEGARPCEITAAIAMILLKDQGIVTVNALSHPGGRVALRFKPAQQSLSKLGGVRAFADALENAFETVALQANSIETLRSVIMGDPAPPIRTQS